MQKLSGDLFMALICGAVGFRGGLVSVEEIWLVVKSPVVLFPLFEISLLASRPAGDRTGDA